jgi:hypothetical protein
MRTGKAATTRSQRSATKPITAAASKEFDRALVIPLSF